MTYLDQLNAELARTGVPPRRRRRIVTEFTDHLVENPGAELGAPEDLAQQFADELGARFARALAVRCFAGLAAAGIDMVVMFVAVGRMRGLMFSGGGTLPTPAWAAPLLLAAALASQVALASGALALLMAWRLRGAQAVSACDARMLRRRAAVGAVCGVVTLTALPVAALSFPHAGGPAWDVAAWTVAGLGVIGLLSITPMLRTASRVRISLTGVPGDLRDDLAPFLPSVPTPRQVALLLALLIILVLTAGGLVTDDPYDGAFRGVADALVCLAGYGLLGRYLGLRNAGERTSG